MYTRDFQYNTESCFRQKFSDDSTVIGCINGAGKDEYGGLADRFGECTASNHLFPNVDKAKEMVIDFRTTLRPPRILDRDIELIKV